jgi:peptide deformylase
MKIVLFPNEILNVKCTTITDVAEVSDILKEMSAYVSDENNNAVGLALPQVGITKRGFVVRMEGKVQICINPTMISKTGRSTRPESCLSIPGYSGLVDRFKVIKVMFKDLNNKTIVKNLAGFDSRAFQHELDHLNGIVITEKSIPIIDQELVEA